MNDRKKKNDGDGGDQVYEVEVQFVSGVKRSYKVDGWDFSLPNWVVLVGNGEAIYLRHDRVEEVRTPFVQREGGGPHE
jgi:hypothetical protein